MPITIYNKGFTLIEVLLAMTISAFIALAGYSGISTAAIAARNMEDVTGRMADIQLAINIMERDINNIINRPVRNEYGQIEPGLEGSMFDEYLLQFTRGSLYLPDGVRKSRLARIRYKFNDNTLVRVQWNTLDRSEENAGKTEVDLLDGVEEIFIEYLNPLSIQQSIRDQNQQAVSISFSGQWEDSWTTGGFALELNEPLPLAVRVTMNIKGLGQVQRIFSVN